MELPDGIYESLEPGLTQPFTFLGPVSHLAGFHGERPVSMVWDLAHPMPAELFERNRRGG